MLITIKTEKQPTGKDYEFIEENVKKFCRLILNGGEWDISSKYQASKGKE